MNKTIIVLGLLFSMSVFAQTAPRISCPPQEFWSCSLEVVQEDTGYVNVANGEGFSRAEALNAVLQACKSWDDSRVVSWAERCKKAFREEKSVCFKH